MYSEIIKYIVKVYIHHHNYGHDILAVSMFIHMWSLLSFFYAWVCGSLNDDFPFLLSFTNLPVMNEAKLWPWQQKNYLPWQDWNEAHDGKERHWAERDRVTGKMLSCT